MQDTDIVIIGGGHNGLVCATYLAAAGLQVTVLERRGVTGGAAISPLAPRAAPRSAECLPFADSRGRRSI